MVVLILSACSDDSVFEGVSENTDRDTRIADALDRLDSRNYDAVISELSLIYTTTAIDPQVYRILASAYMGKAGLDLTLYMDASTKRNPLRPYGLHDLIDVRLGGGRAENLDGNAVYGRTENAWTFEVDRGKPVLGETHAHRTGGRGAGERRRHHTAGYACAAHFI
jgi:hypothetical protein